MYDVWCTTVADLLEALQGELALRRKEKVNILKTFARVDEERNHNVYNLIKETKKLRRKNKILTDMVEVCMYDVWCMMYDV